VPLLWDESVYEYYSEAFQTVPPSESERRAPMSHSKHITLPTAVLLA
jgi:hypothetical protein